VTDLSCPRYRRLARLLPSDFRHAHGAELEAAAAVLMADARATGGALGAARAWLRLALDTSTTALALRWSSPGLPSWAHRGASLTIDIDSSPRPLTMFETFSRDLRFAVRSLRRQPMFTLITVLTLALGIGANTAVFSVLNGVILRPLPYPEPERLEYVTTQFPGLGFNQFWMSLPEFVEYRDNNRAFESIGGYSTGAVNLGTSPPTRPVAGLVTPELMPTLGVRPISGRWFTPEDSLPGAPDVVILSYELWQRAYGGKLEVVGTKIDVNNAPAEVVGIMPRGYDVHDQKIELWRPLTMNPAQYPKQRGGHFLYLVGRLKPGVNITQANDDINRLLKAWPIAFGKDHVPDAKDHRLRIDPLKEDMIGSIRTALLVLQFAVGFVLLIACANLANLIIARADTRSREYAVRTALGASRWRLLSQLLAEGLVLSVAGAVVGTGLAVAGVRALLAVNQNALPRTGEIALDWRVLAFTLVVAVATGVIFGLVPMLHLRRDRAGDAIKDAGARTTAGTGRARMRALLVVGEIALAVLLVVGAGLLIRSFYNLTQVDLGFKRSQLTTFGVILPSPPYDPQKRVDFFDRLMTSLKSAPGVESVAAMSGLPPLRLVNANDTDFEDIPNNRPPDAQPMENVDFWQGVTLGYAETMGIPVVKGRSFEAQDLGGAPVVLVNEALAARFFPDRDPIGRRVRINGDNSPWFTIVGVLKDVKDGGVDAHAGTELYLLNNQLPRNVQFSYGQMNVVVRSALPLATLAPTFRQAVGTLDPTLPLVKMRAMDDVIDDAIARPRFLTLLLGVFAGLALLLAAVGTYGILSYLVSERRQEIGIRMALGADRAAILRTVLTRGLVLGAAGLVIGLGASFGLTRVLRTLLFNVTPTDPLTLVSVSVVIAAVATLACLIPALRATRVDPLTVLRQY
jgi:predicted permease